jgi:5'-nucleotidase
VDEAFFLGGVEKKDILKAFGAQIFFDDQSIHTVSASEAVPAALVPYCRNRKRASLENELPTCCTG